MKLTNEEIFYLEGMINQQLEDYKWTLTSLEVRWRFDLKSKIHKGLKNKENDKINN